MGTVDDVLESEAQAKEILAAATREADALLAAAKADSLKIFTDNETAIRAEREKKILALKTSLEKEKTAIASQRDKELAVIEALSKKHMAAAVDQVLARMEKP